MASTEGKKGKRRGLREVVRALALAAALALLPALPAGALDVFAGSAAAGPLKELAVVFEASTGEKVNLHTGGSGAMLAQISLTGRGDVYVAGSPDFMETAVERGVADPSTEVRVAYLVPAICVRKGNPKNIRTLADLARPGVRVGLGRPDNVCVGLYGVEALERAGVSEDVRKNVVTQVESCERTAQILSLGLVDAVLGWDVFARWDPENIEALPPAPGETPRIAYIAGAVVKTSKNPARAREFLNLLDSPEGRAKFSALGYITDLKKAEEAAGRAAPAGGRYQLPPAWK